VTHIKEREGETAWRKATQYLAIPLGGLAPAHRETQRWHLWWRRHASLSVTAAGCLSTLIAVILAALPRPMLAYADATHLRIGDTTMQRASHSPAEGYVLYQGDAAILLSELKPSARAAGAASLSGQRASGVCSPAGREAAAVELCTFHLGGTTLSSRDLFDARASTWQRTYSTGCVVRFEVPRGQTAVPLPLPLGC
jgi:hypothetical protein